MKALVKDGVCVFAFEDDKPVSIKEDRTVVGDPVELHIADCNNSNSVLYEGVTLPPDWNRLKYLFDGVEWKQNPQWDVFVSRMQNRSE
jgi:hypothetical protein